MEYGEIECVYSFERFSDKETGKRSVFVIFKNIGCLEKIPKDVVFFDMSIKWSSYYKSRSKTRKTRDTCENISQLSEFDLQNISVFPNEDNLFEKSNDDHTQSNFFRNESNNTIIKKESKNIQKEQQKEGTSRLQRKMFQNKLLLRKKKEGLKVLSKTVSTYLGESEKKQCRIPFNNQNERLVSLTTTNNKKDGLAPNGTEFIKMLNDTNIGVHNRQYSYIKRKPTKNIANKSKKDDSSSRDKDLKSSRISPQGNNSPFHKSQENLLTPPVDFIKQKDGKEKQKDQIKILSLGSNFVKAKENQDQSNNKQKYIPNSIGHRVQYPKNQLSNNSQLLNQNIRYKGFKGEELNLLKIPVDQGQQIWTDLELRGQGGQLPLIKTDNKLDQSVLCVKSEQGNEEESKIKFKNQAQTGRTSDILKTIFLQRNKKSIYWFKSKINDRIPIPIRRASTKDDSNLKFNFSQSRRHIINLSTSPVVSTPQAARQSIKERLFSIYILKE